MSAESKCPDCGHRWRAHQGRNGGERCWYNNWTKGRVAAPPSDAAAPLREAEYRCDFDCDVCVALRAAQRTHDETHGEAEQCGPECVPFLDAEAEE